MADCVLRDQQATIDTPWSRRGPGGRRLSAHFRWVIFRAAWARRHSPRWFTGLLGLLLYLIRFPQSTQCNLSGYGSQSSKPVRVCARVHFTLTPVSNSSWFPPALSLSQSQTHLGVCSAEHTRRRTPAHTHTHANTLGQTASPTLTDMAYKSDKRTIYSAIHWAIVCFSKAAAGDSS